MSFSSDWLIGSVESLPAYAYNIDGTAYGIATGDYYLYDGTGSMSMLQQLEDDMATEGVTGASVFLTETGHVRITASASFSITWTDSAFRDWLGFTVNISNQTGVTASNLSPLIWRASYPGTFGKSPYSVDGTKIYDVAKTESPSGETSMSTKHHTKVRQSITWDMVPIARVWTTDGDGLGGEWRKFYDNVCVPGYRLKVYPSVAEETSSTTDITGSLPAALGPYKLTATNDDWYNRRVESADTRTRIAVDLTKVAEFS